MLLSHNDYLNIVNIQFYYKETIETSNKIKNAGYKLKEMWECDYNKTGWYKFF